MTGTPSPFRLQSDHLVDVGDLLISDSTGNCWRIVQIRAVRRRPGTQSRYRFTWQCAVVRVRPVPADVEPEHVHRFVRHGRPVRRRRPRQL